MLDSRLLFEEPAAQIADIAFDVADGGGERRIVFASGIFQPPVLPQSGGYHRAGDAATHGDDHINVGQLVECFGVLPVRRHVNAVQAAHQPHGVRIDGGFDGGAG